MRLAEDVADLGVIEQRPNLDGRNMTMLLAPGEAEGRYGAARGKPEAATAGKLSRRNRAAARGRRGPRDPGAAEAASSGGGAAGRAASPTASQKQTRQQSRSGLTRR